MSGPKIQMLVTESLELKNIYIKIKPQAVLTESKLSYPNLALEQGKKAPEFLMYILSKDT